MAEQCLEHTDCFERRRFCCEREFWIGIVMIIDTKYLPDTLYNLQGTWGIHGRGQVQPEVATMLASARRRASIFGQCHSQRARCIYIFDTGMLRFARAPTNGGSDASLSFVYLWAVSLNPQISILSDPSYSRV
ncbi:12786_t:CDS:1 [Acaulospora colombiana]|uniref:12786_t:CDS:1 n=1 Tax=Acaulospora colombiana TaxID=27376 RepID=A0ACA9PA02_9GLOM|nr:12786_t:CDS:1 [Acaulospora colombiana]